MPSANITKRSVDALSPSERDTYLWDTKLHGFGLKCTPAFTKTYLIQYRIGGRHGRTRRVTIGRHGILTPEQARSRAKAILGEVQAGGDPAETRAESRKDITITELCDLYLAEGCDRKKPSTVAVERRLIHRHINPLLGKKHIKSLKRSDVERFMKAI